MRLEIVFILVVTLVLGVGIALAPDSTLGAFDENAYAQFNNSNLQFFRLLYACPDGAKSFDECRPRQGRFDVRAWKKAQRDAGVFR